MWILLIPWGFAAVRPFTRTVRFFIFLAATSASFILGGMLDPPVGIVVQMAATVAWLFAFLAPEKLRIGALTADEVQLDSLIGSLLRNVGDEFSPVGDDGIVDLALVDQRLQRVASLEPRWSQVVALLLAARRVGPRGEPPRSWIVLAARHYWHDVRNRRVVGRRPISGPWDFDLYLNVQLERIRSPSDPHEVRGIMLEILNASPPDSEWATIRDLLLEVMGEADKAVLFAPSTSPGGGDRRPSRLDEAWRIAQARYRAKGAGPGSNT